MITIHSDILLHLWLAFLLVSFGGCIEAIRRLLRRELIARGIRP
jgi:hypothetical protein